jgi:hypothetical protein
MSAHVRGADEVARALRTLADRQRHAAATVLYQTAEQIMAESKRLVPVRFGPLRASGHVVPPVIAGDQIVVEAGFSAPYALFVHENPRAGKTGGVSPTGRTYKHWARVGEWKYLERPFQRIAPKLGERLRKAVAAVVAAAREGPRGTA